MIAFIDSSSLFKRFYEEPDSPKLKEYLAKVTTLIVAPTTYFEVVNTFKRLEKERKITKKDFENIVANVHFDFIAYSKVFWNVEFEEVILEMITAYTLKTLDIIQLASAKISGVKTFITSDRQLLRAAQKEIETVVYI